MEYSAQEIAALLGGTVEGNPNVKVSDLSKIEEGKPNTLSFMGNPKYEEYLYTSNASVIIINHGFVLSRPVSATLIRVDDAYKAFTKLLEAYNGKDIATTIEGVEQPSHVHPSAQVGRDVFIGTFSVINENAVIGEGTKIMQGVYIGKNVTIGKNCIIYPGVKIYQDCIIGNHVILHANSVIGADGFGYTKNTDQEYVKVPQIGNVVIEDHVEIGAGTTIDSATVGSTKIGRGVKIDNLVQVAHNVEIGENTAIAALVGISGSTKIGKRCVIAGQVGLAGHLEIAHDITIGAQAGVTKSFKQQGITILGSPAYEVNESKKIFIATRRLPDLIKKIANLEVELDALKKALNKD